MADNWVEDRFFWAFVILSAILQVLYCLGISPVGAVWVWSGLLTATEILANRLGDERRERIQSLIMRMIKTCKDCCCPALPARYEVDIEAMNEYSEEPLLRFVASNEAKLMKVHYISEK